VALRSLTFPMTGSWPANASAITAACPSVLEAALLRSDMPGLLGWDEGNCWLVRTGVQRMAMMAFAVALYGMADRGERVFVLRREELLLGPGPRLGEAQPLGWVEQRVVAALAQQQPCGLADAFWPTFKPSEWHSGKSPRDGAHRPRGMLVRGHRLGYVASTRR
jgi:hypothetical protein